MLLSSRWFYSTSYKTSLTWRSYPMDVMTTEKLWLLIAQVRLGDILISPSSESPVFLAHITHLQSITFHFETPEVSLLPFSSVLCSQLASPLSAQRLCRLHVFHRLYRLGLRNMRGLTCGHQVWTRWYRLISSYPCKAKQWTLEITQRAAKGNI